MRLSYEETPTEMFVMKVVDWIDYSEEQIIKIAKSRLQMGDEISWNSNDSISN